MPEYSFLGLTSFIREFEEIHAFLAANSKRPVPETNERLDAIPFDACHSRLGVVY